jgi:hypothetical protein
MLFATHIGYLPQQTTYLWLSVYETSGKTQKLMIALSYESEVGCVVSGTTLLTKTPSHIPYSTTKV